MKFEIEKKCIFLKILVSGMKIFFFIKDGLCGEIFFKSRLTCNAFYTLSWL